MEPRVYRAVPLAINEWLKSLAFCWDTGKLIRSLLTERKLAQVWAVRLPGEVTLTSIRTYLPRSGVRTRSWQETLTGQVSESICWVPAAST